jgi:hypothetical protein
MRWLGAIMLLLAILPVCSQASLTDPYEILKRHIAAIGGLERLKAEITNYSEVDITVMGLSGTVKTWSQKPVMNRQEIDLKVFKQVSGDNGQFAWTVDANGKTQIAKDQNALDRRRIAALLAEYENLNPKSQYFDLAFSGVEKVGDKNCYVIRMTNTINSDVAVTYFDTSTFLIERSDDIKPDDQSITVFSDYRDIDGVKVAFHQEVTQTPGDQKTTVQVTVYQPNVEIDPALFEPPSEDVADYQFDSGTSAENIPFEYLLEHIFIPVTLDGKTRLWVLDSGAGISVVDSSFADTLGLKGEGDVVGQGVGGTVSISFVKLPPYVLEGVRFDSQTVGCLNLQPIIGPMGIKVAGILGYDCLSRFVVKVDYAHRKLSLYDPKTFAYSGAGVVLDAPLNDNLFTIPITVDGSLSGRCALDLGSGDVTLNYPFARDNALLGKKGVEVMGRGAGGTMVSREVQFETIELAGYTINRPVIEITTSDLEGTFGGSEVVGNVGNYLLRHFVIYLDYANQKVTVEKGANFGSKFPTPKSGLQLQYNESGEVEVMYVAAGTPAQEAGLQVGDVVLEINGIPTRLFAGLSALRDMLSENAGTKYEFFVRRGERIEKHKLTLRYLYGR